MQATTLLLFSVNYRHCMNAHREVYFLFTVMSLFITVLYPFASDMWHGLCFDNLHEFNQAALSCFTFNSCMCTFFFYDSSLFLPDPAAITSFDVQ